MESRNDFLHWAWREQYVLLPIIRLTSFPTFLAASLLTVSVCFCERFLTFASERRFEPKYFARGSWLYRALWRAILYGMLVFLRLGYMLIAMTLNMGLLLVIVTSLASAQFLIEAYNLSREGKEDACQEPLLHNDDGIGSSVRSRTKSKPGSIFIHPNHSNIARADAVALQLGLGNDSRENTHIRGNSRQYFHLQDEESSDNE